MEKKNSHFVDYDKEMMNGIGLTTLQIKRLDRIFGAFLSNTHECCGNSIPGPSGLNLNPSCILTNLGIRKENKLVC